MIFLAIGTCNSRLKLFSSKILKQLSLFRDISFCRRQPTSSDTVCLVYQKKWWLGTKGLFSIFAHFQQNYLLNPNLLHLLQTKMGAVNGLAQLSLMAYVEEV